MDGALSTALMNILANCGFFGSSLFHNGWDFFFFVVIMSMTDGFDQLLRMKFFAFPAGQGL